MRILQAADDAGSVRGGTRQWYVIHTRARQEKILAEELRTGGATCLLPLVREQRIYAGVSVAVEVPAFAGFVFLLGTTQDAAEAARSPRVIGVDRPAAQARIGELLSAIGSLAAIESGAADRSIAWRGRAARDLFAPCNETPGGQHGSSMVNRAAT